MLDAFKENLLRPIIARVGTLLATILLTHGFDTQVVEPFVQAVTAVVLIGIDLLLSRYYRKLAVLKYFSGFGVVGRAHPWKAADNEFANRDERLS